MSTPGVPPWGVPWHGKVQGGVLTLPNGTTLPWGQPSAVEGFPEVSGYTFAQKMPGVAAITRTTEEAAADALEGREWRNQFIVGGAGGDVFIHGKRAGGWIYSADDGTRWVCTALGESSFSQGGTLSMSFQFRRFGVLGGAAVTVQSSASISSAGMGQLSPTLSGVSNYLAQVEDIAPDGRSAIVMLYPNGLKGWPVGFLLLTLSGTPGVAMTRVLSVIYTRGQTLGTATGANGITVHSAREDPGTSEEVADDQRGPAPNCGYIDYIKESVIYTPTGPSGQLGEDNRGVSSRVIAVLFNAGSPTPVTLTTSGSVVADDAPVKVTAIGGQHIYRANYIASGGACVQGAYTLEGSAFYTRSLVGSITAARTITMSYAGASVSFTESRDFSRSSSNEWVGQNFGPFSGQSRTDSDVSSGTLSETQMLDGVVTFTQSRDEPVFIGDAIPSIRLTHDQLGRPTGTAHSFDVLRMSNNILALTAVNTATGARLIKPLCPTGALAPLTTASGAPATYSAYNPITGEADVFSATPVSWS